ncbi:MAG: hypothetical protein H0T13_09115 [Actinobacteria bacterium]|nr:hypothetical protein [Actinomycetota bacterium]
MRSRAFLVVAALVATAAVCVPAASASRFLQHGIFDDASIHYGDPDQVFPQLKTLRTQLIRINLIWGGVNGVAKRRPVRPTNPDDPAYDWSPYDRTVNYAAQYGMKVVFSIIGTPPWANKAAGVNVAPTNALDLQRFAAAAALRYSGTWKAADGRNLPPVRSWLAWNEPNNPVFLRPQYRRVGGKFVMQGAKDYARICNAVVKGVRTTSIGASKVACGVTGPRGNNNPGAARASTSPLAFLRAMKTAGASRLALEPLGKRGAHDPGRRVRLGPAPLLSWPVVARQVHAAEPTRAGAGTRRTRASACPPP